jgi:membrane-bound lytic murein transglycosylase B
MAWVAGERQAAASVAERKRPVAGCGMIRRRLVLAALPSLLAAGPARADTGFAAFLADMRAEAVASGIAEATVDRAFAGLRPNAKVLELDSHPPEKTQSWDHYRATRVSDARIAAGRKAMAANADALAVIGQRYGVDPAVVVAIWGLETNYGGYTGGFSVVEALATLAADGRRDGYFRTELLNALRILDAGNIAPSRMTGSYAGAMGQPQFMPSSYLQYAVSFDGSPRRDIWDNRNDALASIANYLSRSGWQPGAPWGQLVRVPAGFGVERDSHTDQRPLAAWMQQGVTRLDGSAFSQPDVTGAVVMPDGAGGEAYMTYANFAVIRLYNHSDLYALSVGILADRIR